MRDTVRTAVLGISTALLALAVFLLWLILQEQREQRRELTNCVFVLQDSIGATPGEPVRRCPIE